MAENKNKVAFYRGAYGTANWLAKATDVNGVYFNNDTKTIAVNGVEYGGYTDKMVKSVDIENGKLVYEVFDAASNSWNPIKVELEIVKAGDKSVVVTPQDGDDFSGVEVKVNLAPVAEGADGLKLGENGIYVDLAKTTADIAALKNTTYTGENAITVEENKIALKLAETEKVLSQSADGLVSTLSLKYDSDSNTIGLFGKDVKNAISSIDTADFVVDGFLESVEVKEVEGKETLVFTWNTEAGVDVTNIDLSKYIDVYKAGNGLDLAEDKTFSVKRDEASEEFLTVGADGIKLSGIKDFVQEAIDNSLVWNELAADTEDNA